jgi:polyprenyl-phospho-N-acetylgalactosaminyl synthase
MESSEVFVVVPAFNENAVLRSTISGLVPFGYTIVVVDDGSTIPAKSQLDGLSVYCLRHAVNLGQGAALQTGTAFALLHGAGVIVHFDADGQHNPALIARLIEPVIHGDFDVALGSRFLDAADRNMIPLVKRVLLKVATPVSWAFTGVWLSDAHNGFRALSRHAAGKIQLRENGFAHATEILELLRREKLSYTEVPVAIRYTNYSRSKGQSVFNSFNIVIDLMLRKLFK